MQESLQRRLPKGIHRLNRTHFSTVLFCLFLSLLGTGCNLDPPKEVVVVQPPSSEVARTVEVPSDPVIATPEASAPTGQSSTTFRLRTSFIGKSEIAFAVVLNDRQIGTFNTDAESDLTPYVQNGTNTVRVTWENKPGMESDNVAKLFLESQRVGQDSWNIVFSREVTRESKDTESEGAFTVGPTS